MLSAYSTADGTMRVYFSLARAEETPQCCKSSFSPSYALIGTPGGDTRWRWYASSVCLANHSFILLSLFHKYFMQTSFSYFFILYSEIFEWYANQLFILSSLFQKYLCGMQTSLSLHFYHYLILLSKIF